MTTRLPFGNFSIAVRTLSASFQLTFVLGVVKEPFDIGSQLGSFKTTGAVYPRSTAPEAENAEGRT